MAEETYEAQLQRLTSKWLRAMEAMLDCLIYLAKPESPMVGSDASLMITAIGGALAVMETASATTAKTYADIEATRAKVSA